jgi:hypothetical protein
VVWCGVVWWVGLGRGGVAWCGYCDCTSWEGWRVMQMVVVVVMVVMVMVMVMVWCGVVWCGVV